MATEILCRFFYFPRSGLIFLSQCFTLCSTLCVWWTFSLLHRHPQPFNFRCVASIHSSYFTFACGCWYNEKRSVSSEGGALCRTGERAREGIGCESWKRALFSHSSWERVCLQPPLGFNDFHLEWSNNSRKMFRAIKSVFSISHKNFSYKRRRRMRITKMNESFLALVLYFTAFRWGFHEIWN